MPEFERATPILRVRSLAASVDHYVNVLGFRVNWQHPYFASVSRGGCAVFLSEGDQGNPGSWIWVGVSNVDELCEELRSKGAKIRNPPTNFPWACEMQIEDLDGNVLRMGSDSNNQPFGAWLDMYGSRWATSGDGVGTREPNLDSSAAAGKSPDPELP